MERKRTLKNIIFLTIIGFIMGFLKVEIFLINIPIAHTKLARITSYVSLGIGSLFFYLVVIISILTAYFTVNMMKMGSHFNYGNFYKSVNIFVYALMANEISKFFITIFFYNNKIPISSEETMLENLKLNRLWFYLTNASDYLFFISGAIISGVILNKMERHINLIESLLIMLTMIIPFMIFRFISV